MSQQRPPGPLPMLLLSFIVITHLLGLQQEQERKTMMFHACFFIIFSSHFSDVIYATFSKLFHMVYQV